AGEGTPDELEALLAGEPDADRVAGALAAALGTAAPAVAVEDTSWATRRLLETLARRRPLLVVLEDLHWAEPTFLGLVESLAAQPVRAPLLVLCLARPELVEERPGWPAAETLALEPLADDAAAALVDAVARVPTPALGRVLEAGGGNPLFLEQLAVALTE